MTMGTCDFMAFNCILNKTINNVDSIFNIMKQTDDIDNMSCANCRVKNSRHNNAKGI